MPELPEVEIFRRFVECHVKGKSITYVDVNQPKILKGFSPQRFASAVTGGTVSETRRLGKQLFVGVKQAKKIVWLYFHFGMTGYFSWFDDKQTVVNAYGDPKRPLNHIRVQFDLSDGSHWAFHEQRMFGSAGIIDDLDDYLEHLKLGPDALDGQLTEGGFIQRLASRKGQLKPVLMDQALVAGIGNVYADEILYQCKLSPKDRLSELSERDEQCLYRQMKEVLQTTVDVNADRNLLPQNYMLHVRKKNGKCPRDKTPFTVETIGGRTTYYCPHCQK